MSELMSQHFEMLQLTNRVFDNDPQAGRFLVEQLLFLTQGMIASGFETGKDTMLRQVMA
jgi:hypothetical protein